MRVWAKCAQPICPPPPPPHAAIRRPAGTTCRHAPPFLPHGPGTSAPAHTMATTLEAIRFRRGAAGERASLQLLEQRKLPLETEWLEIEGPQAAWTAIRDMTVRGAPAIGEAAAGSRTCSWWGGARWRCEDTCDGSQHTCAVPPPMPVPCHAAAVAAASPSTRYTLYTTFPLPPDLLPTIIQPAHAPAPLA